MVNEDNIKKFHLLLRANELIGRVESITDEAISESAFDFIKKNKSKLFSSFLVHMNLDKKAIFLAGSPGAGKTELATAQSDILRIDRIDTDEIRKLCPYYSGENSHLFQRASSKGVSLLMDKALSDGYSFILDGNFSDLKIQRQNVERALLKRYEVELNFVYRPLDVAKKYLATREKKDKRHVSEEVFYQKFVDSISTLESIAKEFNLSFDFYNLSEARITSGVKSFDQLSPVLKDDLEQALNYLKHQKSSAIPTGMSV